MIGLMGSLFGYIALKKSRKKFAGTWYLLSLCFLKKSGRCAECDKRKSRVGFFVLSASDNLNEIRSLFC